MHRKGRHADIELVADVASLGVVRRKCLVGLSVSRQVGGGSKKFSTLWTLLLLGAMLLFHRRPAPEHINDKLRVIDV